MVTFKRTYPFPGRVKVAEITKGDVIEVLDDDTGQPIKIQQYHVIADGTLHLANVLHSTAEHSAKCLVGQL